MTKSIPAGSFLSSLLFALYLTSSSALYAAESIVTPPKTQCFIEIQDAHISTTILELQGRLAVKINALSKCNVPQSNVVLTVKIFKNGFGAPHLVAQKSTKADGLKSNGLIVKNQFTYAYCKNTAKTKYYGIASARATINGKVFIAPPVWSEKTIELKCGT